MASVADDDDQDMVRVDEDADPHALLDPSFVGLNTPSKRSSKSEVWLTTKRLRGRHPEIANGMTHVCCAKIFDDDGNFAGYCNTFMKCFRDVPVGGQVGSWKTTKPGNHLAAEHKTTKAGAAVAARAKCAGTEAEKNMFSFGSAMNDAATGDKTVSRASPYSSKFFKAYELTPNEAITTAQAQSMVYTAQKISKRTLDDEFNRNLIYTAAGRKVRCRVCFHFFKTKQFILTVLYAGQDTDSEGACAIRAGGVRSALQVPAIPELQEVGAESRQRVRAGAVRRWHARERQEVPGGCPDVCRPRVRVQPHPLHCVRALAEQHRQRRFVTDAVCVA